MGFEVLVQILNLILLILVGISVYRAKKVECSTYKEYSRLRGQACEFILTGLAGQLTKEKDDFHRATIFGPAGDKELKIVVGPFHKPEDREIRRLPLNRSIAGWVYMNGETYYSPDVLNDKVFTPSPNKDAKYRSLVCVPIGKKAVKGVLSLDAQKVDCFSRDEIDHLEHYASLLTVVLDLDEFWEEKEAIRLERGGANHGETQNAD